MEKSEIACVSATEELPRKFELAEMNAAVMVWLPTLSELVENCAAPPESVEKLAGVPPPSTKKLTVPLRVPPTEDVTLAVKVTE